MTRFLTVMAASIVLMLMPVAASAGNLVFRIKSSYTFRVQIEFYSQNRNFAWPGGNKAYNLDDSQIHQFSLNCRSGEKICYGAWVTGNQSRYWGTGLGGRQACSKCCFTCDGGQTPIITLHD